MEDDILKIRIEFEDKNELDKILADFKKLYDVKFISKFYNNRPPSKAKRIYVDLDYLKK